MSRSFQPPTLIAHLTDRTREDEPAFLHALALAAASPGARLVTIHASGEEPPEVPMPDAATWLRHWGKSHVGFEHRLVSHAGGDDVIDTLLEVLGNVGPDLIVASTHARKGAQRLFAGSVAEAVARNTRAACLLLPRGARGFVDAETGAIRLERLLVPVGTAADGARGLDAASWLLSLTGIDGEIAMLHVDDGQPAPVLEAPEGARTVTRSRPGPLEQAIVQEAGQYEACALVMATHGHDGFRDVILGSHTERVLRDAPCPVLSVPWDRGSAKAA